MYKSFGRREVEGKIFRILEREFCNLSLLRNPRIMDVIDQIEKYCIHWYSPDRTYVEDIAYTKCILPRIEILVDNNHHFKVTDEGNILVSLPLLEDDARGNHETKKEIRYNSLQDGMEKVSIYDYRRHGIDRLFKSIRCVYDNNGIETERELEMLKRNQNGSKTVYFFKERLQDYPHIIKITRNAKPIKEGGRVSYYDIRGSRQIEDLNQRKGTKIEEKDIKGLTEEEKQEILKRQWNPMYQKGLKKLMGIGLEPEER